MLVVFSNNAQRATWESYTGSTPNTDKFNLIWAQGSLKGSTLGSFSASDYVGWALVEGAIKNNDVMAFNPGWDNHGASTTPPVSRNNGLFYENSGWKRVVCDGTMPDMVVIASYNEYGEETAVMPTDTSGLPVSKRWSSPTQYWDITTDFNTAYKNGSTWICN